MRPGEADRLPGVSAVDRPLASLLACLLLQRDAAFHGGLQTAILSEQQKSFLTAAYAPIEYRNPTLVFVL